MKLLSKKIILASSSPRRKELLSYLGYPFTIAIPFIDESVQGSENPETYVKRMSLEKAQEVARDHKNSLIIAADTAVVFQSQIIGKPLGKKDAFRILKMLSGVTHQVYSAVSLLSFTGEGPPETTFSVLTEVTFRTMPENEIEDYLNTDEPYDKAGAYAIQGIASKFVVGINGSVTNVIGLPLSELCEKLKEYYIKDE